MMLCIRCLIVAMAFYTDAQNYAQNYAQNDTQIDAQNDSQIDAQNGAEANVAEGYIVVDAKTVQYYVNQIHGNDRYAEKRTKAMANITEDLDYLLTEANQLLYTLNTYGLNVQIRIREIIFLVRHYCRHRRRLKRLGSSHDGRASDNVMADTNNPKHRHRWFFAECTAVDIKQFLPLLAPNCLLTTNAASTTPASSWATYNGSLLDLNAVCERTFNDARSFVCLRKALYNNSSPKGDQICQTIYCNKPGTRICSTTFTPEGVICDNRKRCDNGKCVPDTSAASANVDPECVFGDQKVVDYHQINFTGSCEQLINQTGLTFCYSSIAYLCCATCKKFKTNIQGCQFGDKNMQCSTSSRTRACSRRNAAVCCYTCRAAVAIRPTDEDKIVDTLKDDTEKDVKVD